MTTTLIYPIYLDVPMMVSFLATLEGGVSYSGEIVEKAGSQQSRERGADGRIGLPSLAHLLGLSLDLSGRLRRASSEEETVERKVIREHTEASLFNVLIQRLQDDSVITEIVRDADLANLEPGQIVEMAGEVMGNPLRQVLDMVSALAPYMGVDIEGSSAQDVNANRADRRRAARERAKTPTARDEDLGPGEIELIRTLRSDVDRSHVVDLLLRSNSGLPVILTAAREFLSTQAEDYLLGGEFRVVGKVTRVVKDDHYINLLRRTALGVTGREMARELFSDIGVEGFDLELAEPVIESPALQLVPLGIYA